MIIEKNAKQKQMFLRKPRYYSRARDAMGDFLRCMMEAHGVKTIFLPAYIGVSPKEGSGIYDPVCAMPTLETVFYCMKDDLQIDFDDLKNKILSIKEKPFVFLRVNYFGFCDHNADAIDQFVHNHGGVVLEDNAHALFSHLRKRQGDCDATFFSLHKQFPFHSGGMLFVYRKELQDLHYANLNEPASEWNPWQYDLCEIASVRIRNYQDIQSQITPYADAFIPLYPNFVDFSATVPQTYPILILQGNRFKIYNEMNKQGYGIVSLYHTMIEPLRSQELYPHTQRISASILNLPVHQDVDSKHYPKMLTLLDQVCKQ